MRRLLFIGAVCLVGCAHHPRVQNPLPGVFRVAVVPFNNKTNAAPGVDTGRLTEIFVSELQQVPSYEVVPLQEVREVLGNAAIDTNQPYLAYMVARAVHAQAVIVGDITEYDAYYPPRLGMHCEMYAMVTGEPELVAQSPPEPRPNDQVASSPAQLPLAPLALLKRGKEKHHQGKSVCNGCKKCGKKSCAHPQATSSTPGSNCGASTSSGLRRVASQQVTPSSLPRDGIQADLVTSAETCVTSPTALPAIERHASGRSADEERGVGGEPVGPIADRATGTVDDLRAGRIPAYQVSVARLEQPVPIIEPWVVRHSRIFDGANLGLVRKLRDYRFFRKDLRGGDWPGSLERVTDFHRFACNRMIYEMLEGAGGEWTPLRGIRIPKPWEPWPWR